MKKYSSAMRRLRKLRYALNKPNVVDNSGVLLPVGLPGISNALRRSIYLEPYEAHERSVIEKKLDEGDVVLELGAGIGFVSTFCAQRIGGDRVFAVEANPLLIDIIRETYRINNVAPILTWGLLGKGDGEDDFYLENEFISSSVVQRSSEARLTKTPRHDVVGFFDKIRPTFLICDIEGGERDLFHELALSGVKKICIELHPHVIGNSATSSIFGHFLDLGFICDFSLSSKRVFFFER